MTLCTYVLTADTGLAPNPFGGWCTLAVCTPNRQGARLEHRDWIAGFSPRRTGNTLIYLMEVAERIHMNDYFYDPRFVTKRPDLRGGWEKRCGDNFYSQRPDGSWQQHRNRFHIGNDWLTKDTRNPYVFVASRFWYFGKNSLEVPLRFRRLIGTRGIRVNHPPELATEFIRWVTTGYVAGVHGLPGQNPDVPA